jgi:hypothetical protein
MEPTAPIVVVDGGGKDAITAAARDWGKHFVRKGTHPKKTST